MIDLCIDTSSGISIAVVKDGNVVATAEESDRRRHAESLAVLVKQACDQAGIPMTWDRVLVGTGPAPFTGLRAGLVTARIFAKATAAELYGAPSLAVLAAEAFAEDDSVNEVTTVVDARRGEVYWASYRREGQMINEVTPPSVAQSPQIIGQVVGPGRPVNAAFLPRVVDARLAAGEDTSIEPLYLRAPDVHTK